MNHQEAIILLPAYVDKELSLSESVDLEMHLNSCDECKRAYDEQLQMSILIKNMAKNYEPTQDFIQNLGMKLSLEPNKVKPIKLPKRFMELNWFNTWGNKGLVFASLLAIVWSTSLFLTLPTAQEKFTEELVASHVRSLEVDHLSDVISTDQHTVKPWFIGKLDYSPPIINLASIDYPIEGGRLDYINSKAVAVVVYRHNKHPINLYIWPSNNKESDMQEVTKNGYKLVHWVTDYMSYWAISDLDSEKLLAFSKSIEVRVKENQKS